jgi:hypothetical protein
MRLQSSLTAGRRATETFCSKPPQNCCRFGRSSATAGRKSGGDRRRPSNGSFPLSLAAGQVHGSPTRQRRGLRRQRLSASDKGDPHRRESERPGWDVAQVSNLLYRRASSLPAPRMQRRPLTGNAQPTGSRRCGRLETGATAWSLAVGNASKGASRGCWWVGPPAVTVVAARAEGGFVGRPQTRPRRGRLQAGRWLKITNNFGMRPASKGGPGNYCRVAQLCNNWLLPESSRTPQRSVRREPPPQPSGPHWEHPPTRIRNSSGLSAHGELAGQSGLYKALEPPASDWPSAAINRQTGSAASSAADTPGTRGIGPPATAPRLVTSTQRRPPAPATRSAAPR